VSNDWMAVNNNIERKHSCSVLRYQEFCLEGLRKAIKNPSQDSEY
jgi:hypothetical protein